MKNSAIIILTMSILWVFPRLAYAQTTKTATTDKGKIITTEIAVSGVCGMCKKRIETAALIKGVKLAEWDRTTKTLKVMYTRGKTDDQTIAKAIAAAGHDNALAKAPDAVYKSLPGCCLYRDGVSDHEN